MSNTTWGVVATVCEPAPLVVAFACHYTQLGATEIHIYLDAPDPGLIKLLQRLPAVRATVADKAFYKDQFDTRRPDGVMRRQRINANHAYASAQCDWLLHVDADEFLNSPDFAAELAALPEDVASCSVPNTERAFLSGVSGRTIFEGVQRVPFRGPRSRSISVLGRHLTYFTDGGFTGHTFGKSATRTGRDLSIGLHAPAKRLNLKPVASETSEIVHFDGLTPLHWLLKLARYAESGIYDKSTSHGKYRQRQIEFVLSKTDAAGTLASLHHSLKCIEPETARRLTEAGLIKPIDLDIFSRVRLHFAAGEVDLSPSHFDRHLRNTQPDACAWLEGGTDETALDLAS